MDTVHRMAQPRGAVNRSSITGRDSYIVAQALYWFIRAQQSLPEEQFERSNTEDAKLILRTLWPNIVQVFVDSDQFWERTPPRLKLEKYDEIMPTVLAANVVA